MNKKILIFHTSVGLGHKSIAENIGFFLSQAGYEVKISDIEKVQAGRLVNISRVVYYWMSVRLPFIWSFLYTSKWFTNFTLRFRTKVAGKNYLNAKMVIDAFEPDAVITTQTAASGIVAFLKQQGMYRGKFGISFSDYHLHRYWLYDEADFYLANIEEQKEEMVKLGIPADKIAVCGILMPPQKQVDTQTVKNKLGISPEEKVVLVGGGSLGVGLDQDVIKDLSKQPNTKIIAVCGKNEKLFLQLNGGSNNVIVLGYYSPMDELYAIADIFVSKPGGLSTAEALRWRLPVMVMQMLPGQEELNYEYLQDKGLIMPEPIIAAAEIKEQLVSGSFKKLLAQNPSLKLVEPKPEALIKAIQELL